MWTDVQKKRQMLPAIVFIHPQLDTNELNAVAIFYRTVVDKCLYPAHNDLLDVCF